MGVPGSLLTVAASRSCGCGTHHHTSAAPTSSASAAATGPRTARPAAEAGAPSLGERNGVFSAWPWPNLLCATWGNAASISDGSILRWRHTLLASARAKVASGS